MASVAALSACRKDGKASSDVDSVAPSGPPITVQRYKEATYSGSIEDIILAYQAGDYNALRPKHASQQSSEICRIY